MAKINLQLITPDQELFKIEADSVSVPTENGEITILPNHIPLVTLVKSGAITIRHAKNEEYVAVSSGWLTVESGSKITILTDSADRAEHLVLSEIEAAHAKAAELLKSVKNSDDVAEVNAVSSLERELARIKVAKKHFHKTRTIHE